MTQQKSKSKQFCFYLIFVFLLTARQSTLVVNMEPADCIRPTESFDLARPRQPQAGFKNSVKSVAGKLVVNDFVWPMNDIIVNTQMVLGREKIAHPGQPV